MSAQVPQVELQGPILPFERPLRVYAFDPSRGTTPTNVVTLRLPYEPLQPGPIGRYVAVIDREASGEVHDPVDLDAVDALLHGGLQPSELDFGFHQQMAYAVVSRTIQAFEQALGRAIRWPWVPQELSDVVEHKLRVYPHGLPEANAYYNNQEGALYFGYFRGDEGLGEVMYTTLAYDLVAHETVHPLLHSVAPFAIGEESAAFHEGFADLIALLQHFDFDDALLDAVERTGGRIWRLATSPDVDPDGHEPMIQAEREGTNPILELGHQFGHALGLGQSIRTAIGSPDPNAFESTDQPHQKGANLVAAVFDALFSVYARRTRDLMAMGRPTGSVLLERDVSERLAVEASDTARQFLRMCIRALDYCPPTAISIGDYLRALITSDAEMVPVDEWRFRDALIESFRARGIVGAGVIAYSDEGLRWPRPAPSLPACEELRFSDVDSSANAEAVQSYADRHRADLGLASDVPIKVDPSSVHASRRVGPGGRLMPEFIAQCIQESDSDIGGTTLVLDRAGLPKYVIGHSAEGADAEALRVRRDPRANPSRQPRRSPAERRPLKIYAFDPTRGTRFGNHLTLKVPYERLEKGPVGRQVAVIDYDGSNDCYYEPVDLEALGVVLGGGLEPSELDPRFHQQMVYAVATAAIERFESGLGRPVVWRWGGSRTKSTFGDRLLIHPHAMQDANAFYARDLHALLFGYFAASAESPGGNLPGQTVHTCLSHDVVVHETTHAILDGIHPYLLERTGLDSPAFHEAYADIVSLLQHFSFAEALSETIERSGGRIHEAEFTSETRPGDQGIRIGAEATTANPLVDLARQFGEALGTRAALRSALGSERNDRALEQATEAHARGAILVAAVFDAFFSVYVRRSSDLLRIARMSGAITLAGDLRSDLAARLAREATETAQHFATMCVRALDYLPPVDVEFGDFLRALITADTEASPADPLGYRAALIDGFRARGIYPSDAHSLSEEALNWRRAEVGGLRCEGLEADLEQPGAARRNAIFLRRFAQRHAGDLGFASSAPIKVERINSVASLRVDPHGLVRPEFHVQLSQRRDEPVDPDDPHSATFTFRGGASVVLDETGAVRYLIGKGIDNADRLSRQQAYLRQVAGFAPAAAYRGPAIEELDIASLHRGLDE